MYRPLLYPCLDRTLISIPFVSDRSDNYLVHLDGLNFNRAWCMLNIAQKLPANHPLKRKFNHTADFFLERSLPVIFSGGYGREHWLASFAVYALSRKQ